MIRDRIEKYNSTTPDDLKINLSEEQIEKIQVFCHEIWVMNGGNPVEKEILELLKPNMLYGYRLDYTKLKQDDFKLILKNFEIDP